MIFALLAIQLIVFLALSLWVWLIVETMWMNAPGRVLYYGSNIKEQGKVLEEIIQKYILDKKQKTEDYELVEPGAGLALVADYLAKKYAWKKVIGLELGTFIWTMGKIRGFFRHSQVELKKVDLFNYDYPNPAVLYSYLFPSLMDRLYAEGTLKGKLVISLTFPISSIEPTEEFQLKSWQKRILVYDFR